MDATTKKNITARIEKRWPNVVVHDKGSCLVIKNFYSGVLAYKVGESLREIAKECGYKYNRTRCYGNGMINTADWKDTIHA